jgi:hypothetical protein
MKGKRKKKDQMHCCIYVSLAKYSESVSDFINNKKK